MFKNLCKGFFLMSSFSKTSSFGLEISDESLKFVELVKSKDGLQVGRYGERKISTDIIENGEIIEPHLFEKILSSLKKEEGLKSAHVSLPDEQVHILKLKIGKLGVKNIKQGIELALEHNIHLSAQSFVFDYKLLFETNSIWEVQVFVVAKNIMEGYISVFKNSKISILSFETKAQATVRTVIKKSDLETHMIVNLDSGYTEISIVSNGIVILDSVINTGAINLAENINILREEISKHFLFWHTHKYEDDKVRPSIEKIILCGGGVDLMELSSYLSSSLKHKVEVANVWVNILDTEKNIPKINFKQSLNFTTPLGLALEGIK